jgi:PAS domain S-box-containing protein
MKVPAVLTLNLSERWSRGIILVLSCAVLVLTVWYLTAGINGWFIHLYYFPVVLIGYFYRRRGIPLILLLSGMYFLLAAYFIAPFVFEIESAALSAAMLIIIGIIVALLSDSLEKKHEDFEDLIKNVQDIVYRTSDDGTITMASPSFAQLFGYDTPEECLGMNLARDFYFSPDDRKPFLDQIAQDGKVTQYRVTLRHRNGQAVIVSVSSHQYRGPDGKVNGVEGIFRDITLQQHLEQNLRESEEKYRTFFTTSRDCVFITSPDGRWIDFNDSALELFGYTDRDDLFAIPITHLYADDGDRDRHLQQIARDGYVRAFPTRLRRRDGTLIDVLITTSAVRNADGSVRYYTGTIHDITASRKAEEELRQSEEKYRLLADNATDIIWLADIRTLKYTYFSPSVEKIRGYTVEEALAIPPSATFTPESFARAEAELKKTLELDRQHKVEHGRTRVFEFDEFCKDGSVISTETRITLIRNADGVPVAIQGITRDISERKRAEDARALERQRMESLLSLNQIGEIADSTVISLVVEDAIRLTGSTIGYLATINDDESVMTIRYWSRSAHETCNVLEKPIVYAIGKTGLWGEAIRQRRPVITNDYAAANPLKRGTPAGHVPLVRHMNIPVFEGDHIVAVAGVGNKGSDYNEGDVHQLQLLMQGWWQIVIRKRSEELIRESRQIFLDIISFLPDPTYVIDKEGRVIAWNRALEQLSGIKSKEIIGKGNYEYSIWHCGKRRPVLIDLVLDPDKDSARMDYTDILWEGRTVTAQKVVQGAGSGKQIPLSLVASPLIDAKGQTNGAIESMRDISRIKDAETELARFNANLEKIIRERTQELQDEIVQRKYAEREVQEALAYNRSVIEANPDLMVILDDDGIVLDVNAAAESLTGVPREELIGTSYTRYLVDNSTPSDVLARLLTTGRIEYTVQLLRTDGHITPLSVNSTLFRGKDATDTRIIVAAHDITRQKEDEEAIRASLNEKVLLLREIHHRVNNNLQIIISLTKLQIRTISDPGMRQALGETQNRVRAMSLVHEKLYQSENLSSINLLEYTRFLSNQLFSFYGIERERVRLAIEIDMIPLDIDTAIPLGLILNELISNALKHAFPGGRRGTLSIGSSIKGDLLTLVVKDDGAGLPPGLDWKSTDSLGLRLVSSLIDQLDGTIEQGDGAGTMFIITLHRKPT